jgi:hypothetical protein
MKNLWLILFVTWSFYADVRDVLQTQDYIGGPWRDVPGPYPVVAGQYKVPVSGKSQAFFRLRKAWGTPWVL